MKLRTHNDAISRSSEQSMPIKGLYLNGLVAAGLGDLKEAKSLNFFICFFFYSKVSKSKLLFAASEPLRADNIRTENIRTQMGATTVLLVRSGIYSYCRFSSSS